jgi:L-lactate dehydrogenase (cytochrome)
MSTLEEGQKLVEVATPASSAAALSGVPSSASACLNLDDFEKAAEALLKPKAWGACFLSAGRLCPSSLQHLPSLLILERLCIVAYYRSAADDERSKSLAPSSLPVFPELQAAETSASPPSPRQSTSTAAFSWNRDAFSLIRFRPRVLRNVLPVDLSTSILGHRSRMPVYISPAAMGRLAHPEGEKCLVRTAAAHGIPYVVCAFCFCFARD